MFVRANSVIVCYYTAKVCRRVITCKFFVLFLNQTLTYAAKSVVRTLTKKEISALQPHCENIKSYFCGNELSKTTRQCSRL